MTVNQRTLNGYKTHLNTNQSFKFLAKEYSVAAKQFTYMKGLHKRLSKEEFSKLVDCIEKNKSVKLGNGTSTKSLEIISREVKNGHLVMGEAYSKYLYMIRSGEYCGIGVSANVNSRIAALQVGNPVEIELIESVPVESEDCKLVDELCEEFVTKQARPDSQWFLLDDEDIKKVKSTMEKLNDKTR